MLCSQCGAETGSSKLVCDECSSKKGDAQKLNTWSDGQSGKVAESIIREEKELKKKEVKVIHAHFGLRLVSFIVDFCILTLVLRLISIIGVAAYGGMLENEIREALPVLLGLKSGQPFGFLSAHLVHRLAVLFSTLGLVYLVGVIYHTILECSTIQATPGKLLVGIAVGSIDQDKKSTINPPSFLKSLIRNIVKGFPYFPFFAAFFAYISNPTDSFRDGVFPACVLLSLVLLIFNNCLGFITPKKQALQDIFSEVIIFDRKKLQMDQVIQISILAVGILALSQYLLYPQAIWGGKKVAKRMIVLPTNVSSAAVNDVKAEFKDSLALYFEEKNIIKIGFFRRELNSEEKETLISKKALSILDNKKPDLVANINLRKNAKSCSYSTVRSISLSFYKDIKLFEFDGKLPFKSFSRITGKAPTIELSNLGCELRNGSQLYANMQSSATVTDPNDPKKESQFQWNLFVNTPLYLISKQGDNTVSYSSERAQTNIAIYIPETNQIKISFFSMPLTFEEMGHLINLQSLTAFEKKKPEAILTLDIKEGARILSLDSIKSSKMTLFRDVGSITFPGSNDEMSFVRSDAFDQTTDVANFNAIISDNERISGSLKGSSKAIINGNDFYFDWDLIIDTKLYFTEKPISEEEKIKLTFPEILKGTLGYLKVEDKQYNFLEMVSKFDPSLNVLKIALYTNKKSEEEKNKILASSDLLLGSDLQPQAVIFAEMKKGESKFSSHNMKSLTLALYREKFGDFYFPGKSNVRNIIFKEDELKTYEKGLEARGTLVEGNVIVLAFRGTNELRTTKLHWNLQISPTVGR